MFEEPTLDDFLERIDRHLNKALTRAGHAVRKVREDFAAGGGGQSGRRLIFSIDAVHPEFEAGINVVLGELKRSIRETLLDPELLREKVGQRLARFADEAKAAARVNDAPAGVDIRPHLARFDSDLKFALRQFDVGLDDNPEPEVPIVTNDNSVRVGGNLTGNIQQNSPGATQSLEFNLNVQAAQNALQVFELEFDNADIDEPTKQELAADIATIKAQLSKPSPSVSILREAGKSVRNVTEGIVGGMLTSPLLQAAIALAAALGWN